MAYEMKMREFRQEGYDAGFEAGQSIGFENGTSNERIQSARDFISRGLITFDDVKATGRYSPEELAAIRQ